VDEDTKAAAIQSSSIFPLGGSGTDPSLGNSAAAYDFIYYNDPAVGTSVLVGGPYEYISIPFDSTP